MDPEQFNNLSPDDKKAMGVPAESTETKPEQPFSKEGMVNRNFGKDVEKPTEALFYKGGVLNRAKFHESFGRIYDKAMNPGKVEASPAAESGAGEQATGEPAGEQQKIDQGMADLFAVFKDEKDPETAAFNYINTHLDSSLSTEQQLDKLREFKEEHDKIKQQIDKSEVKNTEMGEREKGYFYQHLEELILSKQFGAEVTEQFLEQDAEFDTSGTPEENIKKVTEGHTDAAVLFPAVKKFQTQLQNDWFRNKQNPLEFAQGAGVTKEEFDELRRKAQETIKELDEAKKRRESPQS